MKTTFTLLLYLLPIIVLSQSNQLSLSIGYKSLEISTTYTAPNELIYGIALAVTDSKLAENRANKKDINIHKFNDKYITGIFGLIGGKFDNLSIIGKLGTAYINQNINNIQESQKYYFTAGLSIEHKISETLALKSSYDSLNSLLLGITIHL